MRLRFALEYAFVSFIDDVMSVLSWDSAQALGAFLGGAARLVIPKRWMMTLKNLEASFPEKTPDEREAIALEAWQNAGRVAAEFAKSRHLTPEELRRLVRYENIELSDALLKEGKGILFNIGHLGNWEMAGIDYTARGYPLGVIGRVMKNPRVDAWITETRSHFGEAVFPHRNAFFSGVKWLKRGNVLAILIDHNLHEGGVFVPFFGRPAATSTLSGLLAVKLGCPIISVRVQREGRGFQIRFDGPLRPDPAADPDAEAARLTAEMTRTLEGYVRERPGEWLWGHNRWKRRPET